MREIADGVWQLSGWPANNVNVYVVGDVLVDAGLAIHGGRIMRQIADREITVNALTHAHLDHFGASHSICEKLGLPLWCGAQDAPAVAAGKMVVRGGRMVPGAKAHPVSRTLEEGDEVASFRVLDTPGHSPGHISYWREADRALVCGDVMWGDDPFLFSGGIREPYPLASPEPELNPESARRLAALEPQLVCFGHGPPTRDTGSFVGAAERLAS